MRCRIVGVVVLVTIVAFVAMGWQRSGRDVFAGEKKDDTKEIKLPPEEVLRGEYLLLHKELSQYMPELELRRKVEVLKQEVAAARERQQRNIDDKKAADQLENVKALLNQIAERYPGTAAGKKAQQALSEVGRLPPLLPPPPPPPVFDKKE
jgi:hypothetical protein